jgi:hypothetical protein
MQQSRGNPPTQTYDSSRGKNCKSIVPRLTMLQSVLTDLQISDNQYFGIVGAIVHRTVHHKRSFYIMFRSSKLFAIVLVVLIFATSAFAFAASITGLPATTRAGEGATVIGNYAVLNLDYTLSTGAPSTISAVNVTLDNAAVTVEVSLDGGATFVGCTNTSGNIWSCATTTTVATATQLVIVASDR